MVQENRVISCQIETGRTLVCGEMVTCILTISVEEEISSGGCIRVYFSQSPFYRTPPHYGLASKGFVFFARIQFQTDNPQQVGYMTTDTHNGKPVELQSDAGRSSFTLLCEQGMETGDTLIVTIGDRRAGGPGIEVAHHPTYGDWQLVCNVDRHGNGSFVEQELMPHLKVVTASPSQVLVRTHPETQPRVTKDLQITVTDQFGNHVEGFHGAFNVSTGETGDVSKTDFVLKPEDLGSRRFPDSVVFQEEGTYRVKVKSVNIDGVRPLCGVGPPVVCRRKSDELNVLWGDLHGHSYCSDGTHTPEYYYNYARNIGYLDFCALTDHDTFSDGVWQDLMHTADRANEHGQFTTFLGYEWSGDWEQSIGVLYKNAAGGYYPGNSETSKQPQDLLNLIKDEQVMIVRHDMPPMGKRWQELDISGHFERLVEIYSPFHCSETVHSPKARGPLDEGNSVQAALVDGLRFGFIACSDSHLSMPGRRQGASKGSPGYMAGIYGLTAVYASENTRAAIFDALFARRCYAATDRIWLDFQVNGHRMGSELRLREQRHIEVQAAGTAPFAMVEIIKNNKLLHSSTHGPLETTFEYVDKTEICPGDYYYLRITQKDGNMAWASPVWVDPL